MVLPAWLAQAPSQQRDLAIAHERSHLDARDPQLLALALTLLVCMPWNPSLWWQLRRLRHAIEVDCDTRVLRGGHDLLDYGEALLALGLRRSQQHGLMAASDASQSLLERRIRIMSTQPHRWSQLTACTLVGVALCTAAVAAELAPARAEAAVPRAPLAPLAPEAHLPAAPPPPALPAAPSPPPPPPVAAVVASDTVTVVRESVTDTDDVQAAKAEAEEAAERAAELKNDAEEAEKAAQEARRDADEQQAEAESAKREAEAAEAEAKERKQAAEAAARSAQSSTRVK